MSLFDDSDSDIYQPLAARMRPRSLVDFVGQEHLLGAGKPLRKAIETSSLHSMVLWGPPGVGKTTLARMVSDICDVHFQSISAVLAGVKDIREAIAVAKQQRQVTDKKTLLFVDEAHRFNRSQQDAFLPYVEDGTVILKRGDNGYENRWPTVHTGLRQGYSQEGLVFPARLYAIS